MKDIFSKSKRSKLMSRIKSFKTKPELFFKKSIKGFKYQPREFGRPDFINYKRKIVIFIDGCFWHCCPIHSKIPHNHADYWKPKLKRNAIRAKEVIMAYKISGWKAIRIWEHDINPKGLKAFLRKTAF